MPKKKDSWEYVFLVVSCTVALWLGVSSIVFRVKHPWMTETQLFNHTVDAILFRTVDRGR